MLGGAGWLLLLALAVPAAFATLSVKFQRVRRPASGNPSTIRRKNSKVPFERLRAEHKEIEYQGWLQFGTPPQKFKMDFDTGSPLIWLAKKGCVECRAPSGWQICEDTGNSCPANMHTFDPSMSSSYQGPGVAEQMFYGSGAYIGHFARDSVGIPGFPDMVAPGQLFALADKVSTDMTWDAKKGYCDGLAGLSQPEADHKGEHIVTSLWKQNKVPSNMFTFAMDQELVSDGQKAGVLTFGDWDGQNCAIDSEDDIVWHKVNDDLYWQIEFKSLKSSSGTKIQSDFNAATDTGSSHLFLPSYLIESFLRDELHVKQDEYANYWINCADGTSNYPDLIFDTGSYKVVVKPDTYIDTVFTKQIDGETHCLSLVYPSEGSDFTLGDPFIRSACHVHDIQNKRLGFAPHRTN